jgi:hypothetical protein
LTSIYEFVREIKASGFPIPLVSLFLSHYLFSSFDSMKFNTIILTFSLLSISSLVAADGTKGKQDAAPANPAPNPPAAHSNNVATNPTGQTGSNKSPDSKNPPDTKTSPDSKTSSGSTKIDLKSSLAKYQTKLQDTFKNNMKNGEPTPPKRVCPNTFLDGNINPLSVMVAFILLTTFRLAIGC